MGHDINFKTTELGDILFMLSDYAQKAEDALNMFGEPVDDTDKEIQEDMRAHLATACSLHDKITATLEALED